MGNCCRIKQKEEEPEIEKIENASRIDFSNYIFDKKYIRDDELNKIEFTEKGLIEFMNNIRQKQFVQKFKDETILISILDESIL